MKRWNNLSECTDFNQLLDELKSSYADSYEEKMDEMEREIQNYLDSSEEEWQDTVENGKAPYSVQWYCGAIDTNLLINELELM